MGQITSASASKWLYPKYVLGSVQGDTSGQIGSFQNEEARQKYTLQNDLSRGILNVAVQNYLAFFSKQTNFLPLFDNTEWQIPRARDLADM